jgi:5-methylcytosine-specific restriction enzyme subunit McrC
MPVSKFVDIFEDEKLMSGVFEAFVRNFFRAEQSEFSVRSELIQWDAQALNLESAQYLPAMRTDVTLRSKHRTIVIDTKYYPEALVENYGKKKIRSDHLYQLYAYLKNCKSQAGPSEGILLYPTTLGSLDLAFVMGENKMRVKTVQLNQSWQKIHTELCDLLTLSKAENPTVNAIWGEVLIPGIHDGANVAGV